MLETLCIKIIFKETAVIASINCSSITYTADPAIFHALHFVVKWHVASKRLPTETCWISVITV
jgi:hypothetical protein